MGNQLQNMIHSAVEKYMASRYSERHGLVSSYNPSTYLAKVTMQPGGQESGWLPIETAHIGNGWGDVVGLTPGSGQGDSSGTGGGSSGSGASGQGDQVICRGQEGDIESCKIANRVHSDADVPPYVQPGEMKRIHKMGAMLFHAQDGSVTFNDRTNNGQGYNNNFTDAGQSGTGSGLSDDQRQMQQRPQNPQSVQIIMDGKGTYTKTVHDQTQGGAQGVQNAQENQPPYAVMHKSSGAKGQGEHTVSTYYQGGQTNSSTLMNSPSEGTSNPASAPLKQPPMATMHKKDCQGNCEHTSYQATSTQNGMMNPPAATYKSDAKGNMTHTTYYGGQSQEGTSPPNAPMAVQISSDGQGNHTRTTFFQGSGQQTGPSATSHKQDGMGNHTVTSYQNGEAVGVITMDASGNITLTGMKNGSITLNNAGGGINLNGQSIGLQGSQGITIQSPQNSILGKTVIPEAFDSPGD